VATRFVCAGHDATNRISDQAPSTEIGPSLHKVPSRAPRGPKYVRFRDDQRFGVHVRDYEPDGRLVPFLPGVGWRNILVFSNADTIFGT